MYLTKSKNIEQMITYCIYQINASGFLSSINFYIMIYSVCVFVCSILLYRLNRLT